MNSQEFSIILAELEAITELCREITKMLKPETPFERFEIRQVVRGLTRQSQMPKWELFDKSGKRIWIIAHPDPMKDSTSVWENEGGFIWAVLQSLDTDDIIECENNPILLDVSFDGQFYKVEHILNDPLLPWNGILIDFAKNE